MRLARFYLAAALAGVLAAGCGGAAPARPFTPLATPPPPQPTDVPAGRGDAGGQPRGGGIYGTDRQAWIGIWRGQTRDAFGLVDIENVFMPDGTFTSQNFNRELPSLVTFWGTWDIHTFADGP